MSLNISPDIAIRNQLQFHFVPTLAYSSRFIIAGSLIAVGFLMQVLLLPQNLGGAFAISLALILGGNLLLLIKGYNSKPKLFSKEPTWEASTLDKFRRIPEMEKSVSKWDETIFDISCASGFAALALLAFLVIILLAGLSGILRSFPLVAMLAFDGAILIVPHWVTGMRRGWRPSVLCQQVKALETVTDIASARSNNSMEIIPMLEMSGLEENKVPVGARLMIRYPKAPKDFIGVQFQVNLNNVQGSNYPYLYAVIIARSAFHLLHNKRFQRVKENAGKLTVEPNDSPQADVIIIRQATTKTSGYHTNKKAIGQIAECALTAAENMLDEQSLKQGKDA